MLQVMLMQMLRQKAPAADDTPAAGDAPPAQPAAPEEPGKDRASTTQNRKYFSEASGNDTAPPPFAADGIARSARLSIEDYMLQQMKDDLDKGK